MYTHHALLTWEVQFRTCSPVLDTVLGSGETSSLLAVPVFLSPFWAGCDLILARARESVLDIGLFLLPRALSPHGSHQKSNLGRERSLC